MSSCFSPCCKFLKMNRSKVLPTFLRKSKLENPRWVRFKIFGSHFVVFRKRILNTSKYFTQDYRATSNYFYLSDRQEPMKNNSRGCDLRPISIVYHVVWVCWILLRFRGCLSGPSPIVNSRMPLPLSPPPLTVTCMYLMAMLIPVFRWAVKRYCVISSVVLSSKEKFVNRGRPHSS